MAAIKREWPFTKYEAEQVKRPRCFTAINQEQDGDYYRHFKANGQGFDFESLPASSGMSHVGQL
jgi:hypothetical protein